MFHSCILYTLSALIRKLIYLPPTVLPDYEQCDPPEEPALKTPVKIEFFVKDAAKAVQRGDVIVVIDVLRCSSTIVTALANGAKGITPAKTLKEARMLHNKHPEFILAGERKGIKPKGFDLGNSPLEFTPEKVKNKHIILTTTSGTKAIVLSKNARWVLIGALLNAETVAKAALKIAGKEGVGISLVLSGKKQTLFHRRLYLCWSSC